MSDADREKYPFEKANDNLISLAPKDFENAAQRIRYANRRGLSEKEIQDLMEYFDQTKKLDGDKLDQAYKDAEEELKRLRNNPC